MKAPRQTADEELQELHHEEQPGYRKGFYIVLAVTCIVLVIAYFLGAEIPANHH